MSELAKRIRQMIEEQLGTLLFINLFVLLAIWSTIAWNTIRINAIANRTDRFRSTDMDVWIIKMRATNEGKDVVIPDWREMPVEIKD